LLTPVAREAIVSARDVLASHLRIDRFIGAVILVHLLLFAPLAGRNADDPRMLASFINDEPFLTMALDGMLERPYGNPANYLDPERIASTGIPAYWLNLRYDKITYYGGATFQLAFPFYAVLRAVGAPPFPTAPSILRLISLLAAAGSLVVIYNIARLRGSRIAGVVAAAYILLDPYFAYYASIVHPDALQMFLGLLAFAFAACHARDGGLGSLVMLGVFCGLVQGTKLGGPWLIPMAFAALAFGMKQYAAASAADTTFGRGIVAGGGRLALLGAASVAAYFVSTPYGFVDRYYLDSTLALFGIHTANTLQTNVNIASWAWALLDHAGCVAAGLVLLTMLRAARSISSGNDRQLVLAIVLAVSQFFWFAAAGQIWHMLGYLLVCFAVAAVFCAETAVLIGRRLAALLGGGAGMRRAAGLAVLIALLALIGYNGATRLANYVLTLHLGERNNVYAVNTWAQASNIVPESVILFDDLVYLDPDVMPNTTMRGGVMTWPFVDVFKPDYLILSGSLYNQDHIRNLMNTQRFDRDNPDEFSVRLYQDLLASDAVGETIAPGVELVRIFKPLAWAEDLRLTIEAGGAGAGLRDRIAAVLAGAALGITASTPQFGYAVTRLAQLVSSRTEATDGPEMRLYRFGGR
jgi:hypothetical protein